MAKNNLEVTVARWLAVKATGKTAVVLAAFLVLALVYLVIGR